jgi:O-antigen ligase
MIVNSLYLLFALFLIGALITSLGILIHSGTTSDKRLGAILLPIVIFGFSISAFLSGRTLNSDLDFLFSGSLDDQSAGVIVWINRLISLSVLAISLESIVRYIYVKSSRTTSDWYLFWAFVIFALGNVFINGIFGTHPDFSHRSIYPIIAMLAAFIIAQGEVTKIIQIVRTSLFILLLVSATLLVIQPSLVLQTNYIGLIPSLHYRYWGLSPHANSMGPLTIIFLMCLWSEPFTKPSLNKLAWILGILSLVFTQSKTSFGLALVCVIILTATYLMTRPSKNIKQRNENISLTLIIAALLMLSAVSFLLLFTDTVNIIQTFFSSKSGSELLTLTGRAKIWDIAVNEWHRNIWFGYGPSIWDLDYRIKIGLIYAFHAHNQFFQSLSSGGIIGVSTLVIYAMALIIYAIKATKASKGLSLALLMLLLIQSITEVPLMLNSLSSPDFFAHLLTVIIIAGYNTNQKMDENSHE